MHSGICQGMSWQHLHQPCVAGKLYIYIYISLSCTTLQTKLSLSLPLCSLFLPCTMFPTRPSPSRLVHASCTHEAGLRGEGLSPSPRAHIRAALAQLTC